MEAKSREKCKIRKRRNSSSSSSSVVQKYRFKRAIVVGKRGGSTTPVPTWKTSTKSPTSTMLNTGSAKCPPSQTGRKAKEASVSARRLAATLWEINMVPSPTLKKDLDLHEDTKHLRNREKVAKFPHLSDPSYTPISEKMDRSGGNDHNRRRASDETKKIQLTDYKMGGGLDSVSNGSLMEIEIDHAKGKSHTHREYCITGIKSRLKDVNNGLTASKELLKVLTRIWGIDERTSSSGISLFSALGVELDRAFIHVNQLIKEHRSKRYDIESLIKRFEEEKAAWKTKQRDRIRNAIASLAEELQVEKKLRRQTERLNKTLGKELADTKESLSRALKELESEKRAKEILEQVCDELAKGIGEDRAQVEELKRESTKIREEVEKEREMLQLADVLREERVQMKLSEAKYQFEEKTAAVERLRNELETYLSAKVAAGKENGSDGSPNYQRIKELEAYLKQIQDVSCQRAEREENQGQKRVVENEQVDDDGTDDSGDSDLHSIELNMDNNSRSYKWSYAYNENDVSVDRDFKFKGRKSISENIQWGSICLQRNNCNSVDGPDWDFISKKNEENSDLVVFERERLPQLDSSHSQANDHGDEIMQYTSVKSLRDHILSGTKLQPIQNFFSPTRQWGQTILPMQDAGIAVSDASPVFQGDSLGTRAERRNLTTSRY